MENNSDKGEIVSAFYNPKAYGNFKAKKLDWIDVGTMDSYLKARDNKYSLPKTTGEAVYKINNKCVRLFPDKRSKQRFERAGDLQGLVLPNCQSTEHTLSYEWVNGDTLYHLNDVTLYEKFLDCCMFNVWTSIIQPGNAMEICRNFNYDTTT